MMKDQVEALLSQGIWMGGDGLPSWALTVKQVHAILPELQRLGLGVLGGDVYIHENGTFRPAHMTWYSNSKDDETTASYVARSIEETVRYLQSIAHIADDYKYVLVLGAGGKGVPVEKY